MRQIDVPQRSTAAKRPHTRFFKKSDQSHAPTNLCHARLRGSNSCSHAMSHTPFAAFSALATMPRQSQLCPRALLSNQKMGLRYGRPLPKSGADGTLVEASPAINLKYYGHAVEHSLSFGRNGSASSGGFVLLAKVRPLQFGRTEAPSTPPLPRSLQPDARKRVRRIAGRSIGCGLLGLTGPLMLLVVIALKFESHSAALERQNCIAAGGRRFQMLKFRTCRDPDTAASGWGTIQQRLKVPPPDMHRSTADAHQCAARRRKHDRPKPTVAILSQLRVFGAHRPGRSPAAAWIPNTLRKCTRSDTHA